MKRPSCARTARLAINVLTRIPFLRDAAEIVLAHQEFYDGTGYPRGLHDDQIPLGARIFSIADALDAMISDRPYRKALPMSHATGRNPPLRGNPVRPARLWKSSWGFRSSTGWNCGRISGSPFRLTHLKNL